MPTRGNVAAVGHCDRQRLQAHPGRTGRKLAAKGIARVRGVWYTGHIRQNVRHTERAGGQAVNISTEFSAPTKKLQIGADPADQRRLQIESLGSGATQGQIVHVLLSAMREFVGHARAQGEIISAPNEVSNTELFCLLLLRSAGLLSHAEFAGAEFAARMAGGQNALERIAAINELIAREVAARTPAEAVDDDHPRRLAAEIAARREAGERSFDDLHAQPDAGAPDDGG